MNDIQNNGPMSQQGPEPDDISPGKNGSTIKIVLIVVAALLVVSNIATAYYFFVQKKSQDTGNVELSYDEPPSQTDPRQSDRPENRDAEAEDEASPDSETPEEEPEQQPQERDLTAGEVRVAWTDWPEVVEYSEVYDYQDAQQAIDAAEYPPYGATYPGALFVNYAFYRIGVIEEGPFQGNSLYIITKWPDRPAFGKDLYRVIKTQTDVIVLENHSSTVWGIDEALLTKNSNVTIVNLEPTKTIDVPNSQRLLVRGEDEPNLLYLDYSGLQKKFIYSGDEYVYYDPTGECFIVFANDGTTRKYYYDTEFLGKAGEEGDPFFGVTPILIDVTFSDGTKNTNEYIFRYVGGCGASGCYNIAEYIHKDDVKRAGILPSKEALYELSDPAFDGQVPEWEADAPLLKNMYDDYYPGYEEEKISYEDFLKQHPILYWQDPFGNYIEFRHAGFIPMAECGKPVIYLYPEQETDVQVYVDPGNGFTVTEPAYDHGWFVRATPQSVLYNSADQMTYPYLYWEGYGYAYQKPNEGFVIAQNDLEPFLRESLSTLGLNEKEIADFLEFWIPKMQGHPYYQITFIPQSDFERAAPMSVYPHPDSIIRVFMDYLPLDSLRSIKPQELMTPKRDGFTVVEWGGTLYQ